MTRAEYSLGFSSDPFPYPVGEVFEFFTDLTQIHLWTEGMLAVKGPTRMEKGLKYTSETITAGIMSRSKIEVTELIPNREIQLNNDSGIISYHAQVLFTAHGDNSTVLTCKMRFSLPTGFFEEAKQVAEELAELRIRGNWEVLKRLLAERV